MPTLELTTTVACSVRCTYCPQDTLRAAYPGGAPHKLSLAALRAVLGKLPNYVRVDFSGFAEPWLHPECTEMLRETLAHGFSVAVYTTLQGMSDAPVVVQLLTEHAAQVEVVCLHMPDANGNMRGLRQDDAWRSALAAFIELRRIGAIPRFEIMTMDADGSVAPDVPVERLAGWIGNDRAGTLDRANLRGQPAEAPVAHHRAVSCSYTPFYDQNVLLPNGDVVLCCMDYGLQHVLGNLLRQEYHELFAGPEAGRLRAANMQPWVRSDAPGKSICKHCTRATRHDAPMGARQTWVENKT